MKTTVLFAVFTILSSFSFAQLTLSIDGKPHASGTQYDYVSDTNTVSVKVDVTNNSGMPMELTITRVITSPINSWEDDLCWGSSSSPLDGQCYFGIQGTNPYTTPDVQTVAAGAYGILETKIKPKDPGYGCGEYMYYIIENGTNVLDSVMISVCKSVSIEEISPLFISVAPNPANSYVQIKTKNIEGATVRVVDVLGNVVLKETVMGTSKTINTESFRNGVYFIRLEAENQRPINRKVIVRH